MDLQYIGQTVFKSLNKKKHAIFFSLLRKELNKKVVKDKTEIVNCVNEFIKNIKKEILKNIFNHSTKILKSYFQFLFTRILNNVF